MTGPSRQPGWDKRAINQIASDLYGGLAPMFEAHGWTTGDRVISQIAPTKVVQTYGTVDGFVRAHEGGREGNPMLDPLAAIRSDPPQVWLKGYYGFTPESWGFLGYGEEWKRQKFLSESKPGALVVICGTSKAAPDERLRILGIQQQSHMIGTKWDFLAPERHAAERDDPDRCDKWYYAMKAIRAWRVPPELRPLARDFAPLTYGRDNGTAIGSFGMRLKPEEARNVLDLDLVEATVFGGPSVDVYMPVPAQQALRPSKPGPVSQAGFMVREAEGPKHLYILRLHGDEDNLLGYDAGGAMVVKVGFSVSPDTRRKAHNQTLPSCAYEWRMMHSTFDQGRQPYPSSGHGLAGEKAMKDLLESGGKSLGGEFFLAHPTEVERAWQAAIMAADKWKL